METPLHTNTIVDTIKNTLGISKPNHEMSDDEIAEVMRTIGFQAPDTSVIDGEATIGKMGISAMLSLTLLEFPEFYERHELYQIN